MLARDGGGGGGYVAREERRGLVVARGVDTVWHF